MKDAQKEVPWAEAGKSQVGLVVRSANTLRKGREDWKGDVWGKKNGGKLVQGALAAAKRWSEGTTDHLERK